MLGSWLSLLKFSSVFHITLKADCPIDISFRLRIWWLYLHSWQRWYKTSKPSLQKKQLALTQNFRHKNLQKSKIETPRVWSFSQMLVMMHVHYEVSLKAEHIDLSKPLFIPLKVCINFRFSNLNLAQCWVLLTRALALVSS